MRLRLRIEDPYERPHSYTAATPKINYTTRLTPSETTPDETINPPAYRWFRRDDLVRKCIVTNASFAVFAAGFTTELEPIDDNLTDTQKTQIQKDYAYVKAYVDSINRRVNLDLALFIAQIKRSVFGQAAFEIITDKGGSPTRLISLGSDKIKPDGISKDWKLESLSYNGQKAYYTPEELLFFTNLQLENDYVGVSDVEPVISQCEERHILIKTAFKKIVKRLWAPYTILQANTSMMNDNEEDTFLQKLTVLAQAGESLGMNQSITATVVDMKVDLNGLINLKTNLEQDIISNFGTPRFLLNRPTENRATAYTEFEAYITGPVKTIQRFFKRELERQWCPQRVTEALKLKGFKGSTPVKIKIKFKPIRTSDIYQMANAVAALYNNGLGLIGEQAEVGYEMLGLDPELLQPSPTSNQTTPKTEQQKQEETVNET